MNIKAIVTTVAGLATLALGFIGYMVAFPADGDRSEPLRWADNIYRTIRLLVIEGDPGDTTADVWQLTWARLLAVVTVFSAMIWAALVLFRNRWQRLRAARHIRDHYLICGLGERGLALARDLHAKGLGRIVVVDSNVLPAHRLASEALGVILIDGDATRPEVLRDAGLPRAAHLIALTDCDAVNLQVLEAALAAKDPATLLRCHIHLVRPESRSLFEQEGCFSIERIHSHRALVSVFNLYELASIDLFQRFPPGTSTDTMADDAEPVRILVVGFGELGRAVVIELMTIGHFSNGKPIQITVLDANQAVAGAEFLARHHQIRNHCNGNGLNLWRLDFASGIDEVEPVAQYEHVVAAHDDDDQALSAVLGLHERFRMRLADSQRAPTFSFAAARGARPPRPGIHPFAARADLCTAELMVGSSSEESARRTHYRYARTRLGDLSLADATGADLENALRNHDETTATAIDWLLWENLPLYKRRSTMASNRHVTVKLRELGLAPADLQTGPDNAVVAPVDDLPYLDPDQPDALEGLAPAASRLTDLLQRKGRDRAQIVTGYHRLAAAEHARWNAFHVLDNWRHGAVKSEHHKSHPCLLDWRTLEHACPEYVKYDYGNIYQIGAMVGTDGGQ